MPRKVANSVVADGEAEKFLARLLMRKRELYELTPQAVTELREKLGMDEVSEGAFLRALARVGGLQKRVTRNGVRTRVWCLTCAHASVHRHEKRSASPSSKGSPCSTDRPTQPSTPTASSASSTASSESSTVTSGSTKGSSRATTTRTTYQRLYRRSRRTQRSFAGRLKLYNARGGYSAQVWTCMHILRAAGLGQRQAGVVLSQIITVLTSQSTKKRPGGGNKQCTTPTISRNFARRADECAGVLSAHRFMTSAATFGTATGMAQDVSSGSRHARGLKFSTVAATIENPHAPGQVLQAVVYSSAGIGGCAADKAAQLQSVKEDMVAHGLQQPKKTVVDHETTAFATARRADTVPSGCASHKLMHTVQAAEAVVLVPHVAAALETLHKVHNVATGTSSVPKN